MVKQLLFFPNIPMLAVMCQTNKSGKIEAHSPTTHHQLGSRVSECESQTFGLALCQRQSNHLSILGLSPGRYWVLFCGQASSIIHNTRFVHIKIYVPRNNTAAHKAMDTSLKYLIKTSHRVTEQLLCLKHPITLVPLAILRAGGLLH